MQDIKELTIRELEEVLEDCKYQKFHARQIFSWIYQKGASEFETMSDLSVGLKKLLREHFYILGLRLSQLCTSRDGTQKLLLELPDKQFIEAVSIPQEKRVTGCLSTQVGCKFACRFCASGALGFRRNLTCGEILEQVWWLKNESCEHKLTHLVFMGIGEPLDNYDFVLRAARIINAKEAFNIGARRITISTCGIIPGIKRLATEGLQIELSVSLHSADEKIRSRLMPLNQKYPLAELLSTCREYIQKTNRQVTFEYILIKDINSDLLNAQKLVRILKGLKAKVNLIPANVLKEYAIEPPNKLDILLFRDCLLKSGIDVTLRKERGQDISAACGQLRLKYEK